MADGEANFYTLSGAPGSWIARVQFNGEICERHQQELAAKFAAAPKLLDMLKNIEAALDARDDEGLMLSRIRPLIAEAEATS